MLAAGSNTRAAEPLEPFHPHQARFEVSRNNAGIGFLRAELSRRDDGLWNYRLESEATAWYIRLLGISTVESVWFDWRDGRVLPLTYHHVSREPGSDRFWQHRYLWPELQTRTETLQGEFEIEIEPGVVDPLSLRMAVAAHLSKSPQALEDLEFQVIERDEVERQQYRFLRREQIEVDGRCHDTAVFQRFRKAGSSRNYTVWHSAALGWMPVKIVHTNEDKPIRLSLVDWHSADGHALPSKKPCDLMPPES
ncbi:MAG: DUF3108 domain-containing protein [Wenzhouxiangellaceae bacterium]